MGYPFFTCSFCGTQWDDNEHIVNSQTHAGCEGCLDFFDREAKREEQISSQNHPVMSFNDLTQAHKIAKKLVENHTVLELDMIVNCILSSKKMENFMAGKKGVPK